MSYRFGAVLGAIGFMVAVSFEILWARLIGTGSASPATMPALSTLTDCLWPTNLMLMAWHRSDRLGLALGLMLSAVANGVLYSGIGFAVQATAALVRNKR